MMDQLLHWDEFFFLFFNGLHTSFLDKFFYFITLIPVWIPLYLSIILLIIHQYKKKSWLIICTFIFTILCTDQTCNLVKHSVKRPRPSHTEALSTQIHLHQYPDGTYYYGGAYGFPSAHAANAMAFAVLVIFFLTKRKKILSVVFIIWALLLAYSRIYLGVHYPLDIVTGLILGCCWGLFWLYLYQRLFLKIFFKETPTI